MARESKNKNGVNNRKQGKSRKVASLPRGKLIVIDGIDGSGKATQTDLLKKYLKDKKEKVKTIDFPRYQNNLFGELIGDYLSGKYGDFIKTDPRLASIIYAADRFESSDQIRSWLDQGNIVIADRYVSANQIHQGGKIKNIKKRREFLEWLGQMEHEVFKIPKPDLVIYLDVPFEVSRKWLQNKVAKRKKTYLKAGRRDVAEDNLSHLKDSRNSALFLEKNNKNWEKIECCPPPRRTGDKKTCMSPEEVHQEVVKVVNRRLKIK